MTRKPLSAMFIAVMLLVACPGSPARANDLRYTRTQESYSMPDVVLVNQDGKKVRLRELLRSDKPVIVDFIFGTCTTICPILSVNFANLQHRLGPQATNVRLVSITIDPENDSPKVMKEYLKRFHAVPGWDFLSGTRQDINQVMYAFNAFVPDKMSHMPLTLIKAPGSDKWVRIFGLMGSSEFMSEYQKVARK